MRAFFSRRCMLRFMTALWPCFQLERLWANAFAIVVPIVSKAVQDGQSWFKPDRADVSAAPSMHMPVSSTWLYADAGAPGAQWLGQTFDPAASGESSLPRLHFEPHVGDPSGLQLQCVHAPPVDLAVDIPSLCHFSGWVQGILFATAQCLEVWLFCGVCAPV